MKLWSFQHTKVAEHLTYKNTYYVAPKLGPVNTN